MRIDRPFRQPIAGGDLLAIFHLQPSAVRNRIRLLLAVGRGYDHFAAALCLGDGAHAVDLANDRLPLGLARFKQLLDPSEDQQ